MESSYLTKMTISILQNNEDSRDNMMLVVKIIHDFEMNVLGKDKKDYYDCIFTDKLSSIKTIDRLWRRVQETHEELRGADWSLRQVQAGLISVQSIITKNQLKLF